jgi:hypothetical protein
MLFLKECEKMLSIIGSDNFTVKNEGTVNDEWQQLNQYLIESRNGNSEEYLYVREDQVNELILLLQKIKEIL